MTERRQPLERAVIISLGILLFLSIGLPVSASGKPGYWAFPSLRHFDLAVLARTAALGTALGIGLLLLVAARRRVQSPPLRAVCIAGVCLVLAAVFNVVGPITHAGDWQVMIWGVGTPYL